VIVHREGEALEEGASAEVPAQAQQAPIEEPTPAAETTEA